VASVNFESKIKLIIFDLDGVLVDAKHIHYNALNKALGEKYAIEWNEHLALYDGLKTNQKLNMLTDRKGFPIEWHKEVWDKKQKYTLEMLADIKPSLDIINCMSSLSSYGYRLAVCSNSIRKTVLTVLAKLGIIEYMDLIVSNEDVKNSKPHPEMYWKAMSIMSCLPEQTLIVEDSPYGLLAASRSKSHILRVNSPREITHSNINKKLEEINSGTMVVTPKWKDDRLNVLIPMAGAGTRFEKAGYTFPKPLIDVNGKPMIQLVVENLNIDANYIFVVQKAHREKYNLDTMLSLVAPGCKILETEGVTEGAACTALLAKQYIDNDSPLFFANSDQFLEWDSNEFMYKMNESKVDGGVVTFKSTHPKWSFVKIDNNGFISEVAEKNPISNNATVGFYYWKKGSDFVKYAEQMIKNNVRVNNEFYVCPVFNEAIKDSKKIIPYEVSDMWGLGTPEDLNYFIESNK
jgi:HAD superfamily hydrolase (TIGR01509 family)